MDWRTLMDGSAIRQADVWGLGNATQPTHTHTTTHTPSLPHPCMQGGWPLPASYARFACRPPPALAAYMQAFTAFYHGLDVGRGKRLEWVLREVCRSVQ